MERRHIHSLEGYHWHRTRQRGSNLRGVRERRREKLPRENRKLRLRKFSTLAITSPELDKNLWSTIRRKLRQEKLSSENRGFCSAEIVRCEVDLVPHDLPSRLNVLLFELINIKATRKRQNRRERVGNARTETINDTLAKRSFFSILDSDSCSLVLLARLASCPALSSSDMKRSRASITVIPCNRPSFLETADQVLCFSVSFLPD
jgi:hypothetical protein